MAASQPEAGGCSPAQNSPRSASTDDDEIIDFRAVAAFARRALTLAVSLGLIGFVLEGVRYLLPHPATDGACSIEIALHFPGFEAGKYPDGSRFSPTDLCAPGLVDQAISRILPGAPPAIRQSIANGLTIEPIIPDPVARARERLRDAGYLPPPYVSSKYRVTLSPPPHFPLSLSGRELVLNAIIDAYARSLPAPLDIEHREFAGVFDALQDSDWPEYGPILKARFGELAAYLSQLDAHAPLFRSSGSHLGFGDLEIRLQVLQKMQLACLLGIIDSNGLSRDPDAAVAALRYDAGTLSDELAVAKARKAAIFSLLAGPMQRTSDIPSRDSAKRFQAEQALEAAAQVSRLENEIARVNEQIRMIGLYAPKTLAERTAVEIKAAQALDRLRSGYQDLIAAIRETTGDYDQQQAAGAVRVIRDAQPSRQRTRLGFLEAAGGGFAYGLALGVGLSLLGVAIASGRRR